MKNKKFKNADEFGSFLGLEEVEMELIKQKKKLIAKLTKARNDQGLTQGELAKMLDTKQPAIARMESGLVGEVSLDFLAKVAWVLDISFTFKKTA
jgi:DNA-binding XRE family transcriptional regulator